MARRVIFCNPLLLAFISLLIFVWSIILILYIRQHEGDILSWITRGLIRWEGPPDWMPAPGSLHIHSYSVSPQQYHKTVPGLDYFSLKKVDEHPIFSSLDLSSYLAETNNNESPSSTSYILQQPTEISITPEEALNQLDYFPLGELLSNWNPNNMSSYAWETSSSHPNSGKGILRFNFNDMKERKLSLITRMLELPFILYNLPELDDTIEQYFSLDGIVNNFKNKEIDIEKSDNNHFTYYKDPHGKLSEENKDWKPPQDSIKIRMNNYLELVSQADKHDDIFNGTTFYYTLSASEGKKTQWIRQAFPYWSSKENYFIVDGSGFRGINCRFGMKGVIATNHYDGGRNFVAMIRGRKRYILLPPNQCKKLELYPRGHPSARHSRVDWGDIDQVKQYPELFNALATEVVVSSGEMLYIPSYWFHYIVSQDASIQCNARSGNARIGRADIEQCGFYDTPDEEATAGHDQQQQQHHKKKRHMRHREEH